MRSVPLSVSSDTDSLEEGGSPVPPFGMIKSLIHGSTLLNLLARPDLATEACGHVVVLIYVQNDPIHSRLNAFT